MSAPQHGQYEAGAGWYDSALRAWVDKPDKLSPVNQARPRELTESDRAQVAAWGHRRTFKPNEQMEGLIRLRDSERREEREQFQQLAKGNTRIQLHDYEAAKAEAGEQ